MSLARITLSADDLSTMGRVVYSAQFGWWWACAKCTAVDRAGTARAGPVDAVGLLVGPHRAVSPVSAYGGHLFEPVNVAAVLADGTEVPVGYQCGPCGEYQVGSLRHSTSTCPAAALAASGLPTAQGSVGAACGVDRAKGMSVTNRCEATRIGTGARCLYVAHSTRFHLFSDDHNTRDSYDLGKLQEAVRHYLCVETPMAQEALAEILGETEIERP